MNPVERLARELKKAGDDESLAIQFTMNYWRGVARRMMDAEVNVRAMTAPDMSGRIEDIDDPVHLYARVGYRIYLSWINGQDPGKLYRGYMNTELHRVAVLREEVAPAWTTEVRPPGEIDTDHAIARDEDEGGK
jgi:hypothetical protein